MTASKCFTGKEPVSRKFQSLTAMGSQMVMFGGQSLEDNADLNDLFFLTKVRAPAGSHAEALLLFWGHHLLHDSNLCL